MGDFELVMREEEEEEMDSSSGPSDTLVKHIISSYGGVGVLVPMFSQGFNSLPFFKDNKVVGGITKAVSIGMVGYDIYNKVSKYYKDKNAKTNDKKTTYIEEILGLVENDDEWLRRFNQRDVHMTHEQIQWLLGSDADDLGDVSIKGFYDLEEGKRIKTIPMGNFGALFEHDEVEYLLEFHSTGPEGLPPLYLFRKAYCISGNAMNRFVDLLSAKYMESMGFDKNVIMFDGYVIKTRERSALINFEVDTVDFHTVKHNIVRILDEGQRRGILFVGNPGTGKTTILLKLENELKEYPIVYASATNISDEQSISRLSAFIHSLGKCVVFIEDMDALELGSKTKKIAPLLTLLDNSRNASSVVFVSTINDASLITPSIARTGRFDEVIEIHEPSNNKSIFTILQTQWRKLNPNAEWGFPTDVKSISWLTYFRMKRRKFTQSDYCEIIQKIHLYEGNLDVNDDTLNRSMKELIVSKNTFKKYKHLHSDE